MTKLTQEQIEDLKQEARELESDISALDNKQLALKILLNSLYGAMANEYFRFFDFRNAEGITSTGQYFIRETGKWGADYIDKLSGKKDSLIYIDTDSNYFSLKSMLEKVKIPKDRLVDAIDKFCDVKLGGVIEDSCSFIGDYLNVVDNQLVVKREKICSSGVWVSKKRYALMVLDDEGVRLPEPEIKVTGLEVKRSSTPMYCRKALKKILNIILTSDELTLQKYVADVYTDFLKLAPDVAARPSGVKGLKKYSDPKTIYIKGAPMHVKAALVHNHFIREKGLLGKYAPIGEGNKIKYVNLKMPNPLGQEVFGFIGKLPSELGLESYIDYDLLFNVGFINPVAKLATACKWNYEKKATLDDFFS